MAAPNKIECKSTHSRAKLLLFLYNWSKLVVFLIISIKMSDKTSPYFNIAT